MKKESTNDVSLFNNNISLEYVYNTTFFKQSTGSQNNTKQKYLH